MPHLNSNDRLGVIPAPEARLTTSHKTPLRTYSRRSLKRRHTSPPAPDVERFLTRTESLGLIEKTTSKLYTDQNNQQPRRPIANAGRKRLRFSTLAGDKTPNDLAWEALASSAPALTQKDDDFSDEGEQDETRIVDCLPGQKRPEDQHSFVKDTPVEQSSRLSIESTDEGKIRETRPPEGRKDKARGKAASGADAPEVMSLEESDGEDDSSEVSQAGEVDITGLTSPSDTDDISISATAGSQKPEGRGRFLIFDRSPPKGFKVLHKPRVNPETESPMMKKRKRLTDGFTEDEARPIFLGKRRRLQHLDINVGSLNLTQNGGPSPQMRRGLKPGAERRIQPQMAANLRRGRQYFSASQFQTESQDPVESSEVKDTPVKSKRHELDRHGRRTRGVDNFGPVVIPCTDSPQPEYTAKLNSSENALGELVRNASPSMHLLPKRSMNEETGKSDSLTLRPGRLGWLRPDFVIPETPVRNNDMRW
ncbi:hypothetical protein Daus18300_001606 [Diaporthe australafricana]|uniref:Uncharacterized protein n=1 Tax=Diaporthe australafricana TaxID=127596 RepID=A0ABR3XW43_9PEZI